MCVHTHTHTHSYLFIVIFFSTLKIVVFLTFILCHNFQIFHWCVVYSTGICCASCVCKFSWSFILEIYQPLCFQMFTLITVLTYCRAMYNTSILTSVFLSLYVSYLSSLYIFVFLLTMAWSILQLNKSPLNYVYSHVYPFHWVCFDCYLLKFCDMQFS